MDTALIIDTLLMQGADRFDPVRFRYIQTLSRKIHPLKDPVKSVLEKKLTQALNDYQCRFELASAAAASLAERIALQNPDAAEKAQRLFAELDFNGVTRLDAGLKKARQGESLAELTLSMQRDELEDAEDGWGDENACSCEAPSFEALLRKQEKEALRLYSQASSSRENASQRQLGELKSMRFFRSAWAKLSAEKRVAQAIDKPPENAGPLNSHVLVIRSLATMRDISPDYLNRFVSYIDTLLWLDQAGKKSEPVAEKASVGKAKTKAGRKRSS